MCRFCVIVLLLFADCRAKSRAEDAITGTMVPAVSALALLLAYLTGSELYVKEKKERHDTSEWPSDLDPLVHGRKRLAKWLKF